MEYLDVQCKQEVFIVYRYVIVYFDFSCNQSHYKHTVHFNKNFWRR